MTKRIETNLKILQPYKKKVIAGDVFALWIGEKYYYSRVIKSGETLLRWPESNLIYIYKKNSDELEYSVELDKKSLLVPPVVTNNLLWEKGYFQFVEHRELSGKDILPIHCFKSKIPRGYVNEYNQPIRKPFMSLCSENAGLSSFRTVDDKLSKALGVPLVD